MKHLFVIDDDNTYQLILSHLVKRVSDEIILTSFSNGAEALTYFRQAVAAGSRETGTVLIDINMPVMDGWQFLDAIEREFGRVLAIR